MSKNPKSVEEMTLEEVRDEVAMYKLWYQHPSIPTIWFNRRWPADRESDQWTHPIPASLDTVAALMPEGRRISRCNQRARGGWWFESEYRNRRASAITADGDTELLARFRLLLLILRKESNV